MNKFWFKSVLMIFVLALVVPMLACSKEEGTANTTAPAASQSTASESILVPEKPAEEPAAPAPASVQALAADAAVSVDGIVLKKSELDKKVQAQMKLYQDKIPADRKNEVRSGLKKQLTEDFVMRTLLANEVKRRNITATDKEIQSAMDQIKENLPPDKNLKEFLKENNVSRDDIDLGVRIQKLAAMETGGKIKPSEKEISKFYADNKDKFTTGESVHVRHILVAIDARDDEKIKAENALTGTLKTLFAVAENYPDLKANQNFMDLQATLKEIEEKLQLSRRYYNATVRDFNTKVEIFPNNIIAGVFNFARRKFFEIENPEERENVKVSFNNDEEKK